MPAVRPVLPAAKLARALPSAWEMPNTGMAVPGTEGERPPAPLLAITTAIAPAFAALLVLIVNEHAPRRITAMAPANVPAANGLQPSLPVLMPALTTSGVVPGMAEVCGMPLMPGVTRIAVNGAGTGAGPVTPKKNS